MMHLCFLYNISKYQELFTRAKSNYIQIVLEHGNHQQQLSGC